MTEGARRGAWRTYLPALAVALAVAGPVPGGVPSAYATNRPSSEPTTGSVSGTVTNAATGRPVANACVYLYVPGQSKEAADSSCTAADGTYQVVGALAGNYDVAFADSAGFETQWHNGTPGGTADRAWAVPVTIGENHLAITGINAALVPVGTVSGAVTAVQGDRPLPNACVYLYLPHVERSAAYASCAAPDGTYRIYGVVLGRYDVAFADSAGFETEWYNGTATGTPFRARAVAVTIRAPGQALAGINASLLPVGGIAGTVTAAGSGRPLSQACVYLYLPTVTVSAAYATCASGNGTYRIYGIALGTYDVAFADHPDGFATEWFNGTPGGALTRSGARGVTLSVANPDATGIDAVMSFHI